MTPGSCCRLIDDSGVDMGICIFFNLRKPRIDEHCHNPTLWHFEVLHDGEMKLLCTNDWTVVNIDDQ